MPLNAAHLRAALLVPSRGASVPAVLLFFVDELPPPSFEGLPVFPGQLPRGPIFCFFSLLGSSNFAAALFCCPDGSFGLCKTENHPHVAPDALEGPAVEFFAPPPTSPWWGPNLAKG